MIKQRKLKRRQLIYNFKICDVETGDVAGWLADVSAEGLKMSGTVEYRVGQRVSFFIELDSEIFGSRKIEFSAEVLWSRPDVNQDLTATGLLLDRISPEHHEALIGLMARYTLACI